MPILSNPSGAYKASLIYITLGTLIDIWTIVTWVYFPPDSALSKFIMVGLLITGLALLIIGLLLGPIGRSARTAELPPTEATAAMAQVEQTAAAHPAPVAPGNWAGQVANPATSAPAAPPPSNNPY